MKARQVIVATVAGLSLLGVGFWFGSAFASTAEPGSPGDPLVSKSYVDQIVSQLKATLVEKAYVDGRLATMTTKTYVDQALQSLPSKTYIETHTRFTRVDVPAGYEMLGEAGTEVVLRGGRATAIVSDKGGILDATGGIDLAMSQEVTPNHLLIIPISDGRGLTAVTDIILIVKGNYVVQPSVKR